MRRDFVSVGPDEGLVEADQIMRMARIRHLPVLRDGVLVGVLSHRDLLSGAIDRLEEVPAKDRADYLRSLQIADFMRSPARTVEATASLRDAAERMLRYRIGCLPVIDRAHDPPRTVGLITESDLLRAAYSPDFVADPD